MNPIFNINSVGRGDQFVIDDEVMAIIESQQTDRDKIQDLKIFFKDGTKISRSVINQCIKLYRLSSEIEQLLRNNQIRDRSIW